MYSLQLDRSLGLDQHTMFALWRNVLEITEVGGCICYRSEIEHVLLNGICAVKENFDLEHVRGYFRDIPYCCWMDPAFMPSSLESKMKEQGMKFFLSPLAMECNLKNINLPTPLNGLKVEQVVTEKMLQQWGEVARRAFEYEEIAVTRLLEVIRHHGEKYTQFIGYMEGQVVACGSILFEDHDVVIADIGVIPEARGQGVATNFTGELLTLSKERGYRQALLHSDPKSITIYQSLGFKGSRKFCIYT